MSIESSSTSSRLEEFESHLRTARYAAAIQRRYLWIARRFVDYLGRKCIAVEAARAPECEDLLRSDLRSWRRRHGRNPRNIFEWRRRYRTATNVFLRLVHYVEMRRSLGFKLPDAKVSLINFASFLEQAVRHTLLLRWRWNGQQQNKTAHLSEWARRLSFVRGFARHWSAYDSQTEVPPSSLLPYRPGRAHPYLYSDDEVRHLLQAARQLPSAHGLRGPTYHCLLGLLAVTGLRISEARNLQTDDADLNEGILTIRGAKFGKSRLIPIHPSTRTVLSDYAIHGWEPRSGSEKHQAWAKQAAH
jgi:Phage integrase family